MEREPRKNDMWRYQTINLPFLVVLTIALFLQNARPKRPAVLKVFHKMFNRCEKTSQTIERKRAQDRFSGEKYSVRGVETRVEHANLGYEEEKRPFHFLIVVKTSNIRSTPLKRFIKPQVRSNILRNIQHHAGCNPTIIISRYHSYLFVFHGVFIRETSSYQHFPQLFLQHFEQNRTKRK